MEAATPVKDRSHWVLKKFTSFEEQRTWQVKEWQKLSGPTAVKPLGNSFMITGSE